MCSKYFNKLAGLLNSIFRTNLNYIWPNNVPFTPFMYSNTTSKKYCTINKMKTIDAICQSSLENVFFVPIRSSVYMNPWSFSLYFYRSRKKRTEKILIRMFACIQFFLYQTSVRVVNIALQTCVQIWMFNFQNRDSVHLCV